MSDIQARLAELREEISNNTPHARHALTSMMTELTETQRAGTVARDEWLALANSLIAVSEFSAAVEIMRRVLRTFGPDPMLSLRILDALGRLGRPTDLAELPDKLKELAPSLPTDRESVKQIALLCRQVDDAAYERYEDRWIEMDSSDPEAWLDVAERALNMGQYKWAQGYRPPGYEAAKIRRAHHHIAGALRTLRKASSPPAAFWNKLYLLQERAGLVAESAESASNFYRLAPESRDGMLRILKLYPKHSSIATKADIEYIARQLLSRDWEPLSYWRQLAMLLHNVGGLADARHAALEHCLKLDSNDAFARQFLRTSNLDTSPPAGVGWRKLFSRWKR